MKKLLSIIAVLGLLWACGGKEDIPSNEKNGNGNSETTEVAATSIALDNTELTIEKGDNKVLKVIFTPDNATNKTVTWVSNKPEIATVTDGVVVGVSAGSTKITAKSGNLVAECAVTVVVSAQSITVEPSEVSLAPEETASLTATVLPSDTTDEVEWSSSDEGVATVKDGVVTAVAQGSVTITAKVGNHSADCVVNVKAADPAVAVDLGLSVKWRSGNLGASTPEEYGDYYAWGEVEPYYSSRDPLTWKDGKTAGYIWASYNWANGAEDKLTKYCRDKNYWDGEGEPDGKTVLDPEDDAAHVILGGNWRMPTIEEHYELKTQCTWTWNDTKKGYTVTGTNGKSIFLPAAGYLIRTYPGNAGCGYYWSSSLNAEIPGSPYYAYHLGFSSSGVGWGYDGYRCYGFTVRPVTE